MRQEKALTEDGRLLSSTRPRLNQESVDEDGPILELKDPSLLLLDEDVGQSYENVARSAAAAVGAEVCHLALYDTETEELIARRPRYTAPGRPVPQYRFPLESSAPSSHVVRTGEPYLSNDPASDPLYDPSVREQGVRSVLTVPIRRGHRVLGLLYALNKPGGFSPEDAGTLAALAGAAAVTLENIRLYAGERERRVLNESLREVSRALVGTISEDAALAAVLDQMWRAVRYEAALAVRREGDRLRVAASRGGDTDLEIPIEAAGDLREAVETGQVRVLSDGAARLPDLGLRGLEGKALASPLVGREGVVGAFVVVFERDHPPGLRDGQLVSAFADHAALFLEAGAVLRRERQARLRAGAVARITRLTATRHDPESLLEAVAPELLALSGAERAVLYLRPEGSSVLVPVADAGTTPAEQEQVRALRLDLCSEALAPLVRSRQHLFFQAPANPPKPSLTPFAGVRAMLLLPLISHEDIQGAVALACLTHVQACDASLVELLSDVTWQLALGVENARLFARLSQMASTDELTQLANRRRFAESLHTELTRSRRSSTPLSLVMADIDHLKQINDTFGHPAGDAAIRHVADALRRGRRETDLAARFGGEEFALVLPDTDQVGAVKAAERIRGELADSMIPTVGTVTVSIGVATSPEDGSDERDLVQVADERLYAAKSAGRNQVCSISVPAGYPPVGPDGRPRRRPD